MNKNENAKMEIQKGIEIFTKYAISKAPFDVTEIGVINGSTQNGYSVKIKGKTYNNVKTNGGTCTIGEVVKVLVPQNQYNNMFILKSGSGSSSSGVSSVNGKKGDIELNDIKYITQTLTDNQKTQARTNIGAGTSSFSGAYSDLSNKPTIPTVGNGTITFTQNGTSKGTFTTNQSGNTTIALTDNNTTYGVATSSTLGLIKSGTDITVDTNGNVSVNDDSHNHIINNVDGLQSILDSKADSNNYESIIPIATTSTNGLMNYSDKTFMNKLNRGIGTFTPKFANNYYPNGVPESTYSVDGSCYYTVRSGYYQCIGNVVYIYATMRGYYRIVNLENYQKQSLIVGLPFAMYGGYQTPISIGASSNIFNTYGTTTDCSTNAKATIYNGGLQFWNNNGISSIDLRYSTSMFFLSFAGTYIING